MQAEAELSVRHGTMGLCRQPRLASHTQTFPTGHVSTNGYIAAPDISMSFKRLKDNDDEFTEIMANRETKSYSSVEVESLLLPGETVSVAINCLGFVGFPNAADDLNTVKVRAASIWTPLHPLSRPPLLLRRIRRSVCLATG